MVSQLMAEKFCLKKANAEHSLMMKRAIKPKWDYVVYIIVTIIAFKIFKMKGLCLWQN